MNLELINSKLAWAVLITGVVLVAISSAFVLMTGTSSALLVALFGAVAAQVGKVTLRDMPAVAVLTPNERLKELVAA